MQTTEPELRRGSHPDPPPLIIGDVIGAAVAYWMCVVPHIAIAAWLLLRKSRALKPTVATESFPVTGESDA